MRENVLVDSWGWIEYFSDGPLADEYAKYVEKSNQKEFYTPTIVLYEVYKKIKRDVSEERALRAYAYIITYTSVLALTGKIAVEAAEISLKDNLHMADAIVKATADFVEAKIVTSDEHFEGLGDVELIK
jgi:predicted nucleic acid-binding protein